MLPPSWLPPLYFNPRTPRGGATQRGVIRIKIETISIHAPHEGVRRSRGSRMVLKLLFQSTHPTRGCDEKLLNVITTESVISIHAPHEGVRPHAEGDVTEATGISIHAPHEGVRQSKNRINRPSYNFNPRTPRGGATGCQRFCGIHRHFNPRTPRGGATPASCRVWTPSEYFNPRTPRGGATAICCRLISRVTTCCRPNITSLLDVVRFLNYCTNLLLFSRRTSQAFSHSFRFADVITLLNLLMDHSWFLLRTLQFYCCIFSRGNIFANYLPLH